MQKCVLCLNALHTYTPDSLHFTIRPFYLWLPLYHTVVSTFNVRLVTTSRYMLNGYILSMTVCGDLQLDD